MNESSKSVTIYFRLLGYVKPYWKMLSVSILLLALLAVTEPVFPALMKPLLDEGFTNKNSTLTTWLPIILVVLFLVRGFLGFGAKYASAWVANRIVTDLRQTMFEHAIRLPTKYYDSHSSGRIASHISNNPLAVTDAATTALTVLVRDTLTIFALLAWLIWLDWRLIMITLSLFPAMALVVKYFNKRLRRVSQERQHALAQLTHTIEEAASNNRIVKIFTGEEFERKRFRETNEKQRGLTMRAAVAESAVTPLVQLLASLSVAAVIAIALNSSGSNQTSAGEFISFLTALLMLLPPIKRLTDITSKIQRGLAGAEIIFTLLDEPIELGQTKTSQLPKKYDIEFKNINYSYGAEKNVLQGLSISIPEGMTYALVGKSGSGKSTLISLLSGLYEKTNGEILIGGIPIEAISKNDLRNMISIVSQDIRLFNDSIANNVAYADQSPTTERIIHSLEAAHAMEFINELENGIHTQIGQNGVTLSGGQRQRIAIARAFYKNSPILILDEATSALDSESEKYIQSAFKTLTSDRTSIVIAHRLSTIENADQIVVMSQGQIVEIGKHHELINNNGHYASYYKTQYSI